MRQDNASRSYRLKCLYPGCGKEYEDSEHRLQCDEEICGQHGPALLQAVYETKQIKVREGLPGIFPYSDWLPVGGFYVDPPGHSLGKPICYRSEGLAEILGLKHLYIAFNGFWPERGARLLSGTFKELDCQASIVRYLRTFIDDSPFPFIIASAGNTGNAYNLLCHILKMPVYLVVPERGIERLQLPIKTAPFVVAVKGDYSDAIVLADTLAKATNLTRDGGVRNIASRGGLGTVMLNAVAHPEEGTNQLFDHYFQAVSSGAGAIATWEAVHLLLKDGRFGDTMTRMHVAQNAPFTPIVDAWKNGERDLAKIPEHSAKEKIGAVAADVLTNRQPAYGIAGGVFDTLKASDGMAWKVNNDQLLHAARMVKEAEGVAIDPAAAVAVGALKQAIDSYEVKKDERVLLNITGGGKDTRSSGEPVYRVKPDVIVKHDKFDAVLEKLGSPERLTNHTALLKKIAG